MAKQMGGSRWSGGTKLPSKHSWRAAFSIELSKEKHFAGWSHLGYAKHKPKAACVFSFSLTQRQGSSSSIRLHHCPVGRSVAEPVPSQPGWPQRDFCQGCSFAGADWQQSTSVSCRMFSLPLWWYRDTPCIPWDLLQAPSVLNLPLRRFNTGDSSLASAGLAFRGRCSVQQH